MKRYEYGVREVGKAELAKRAEDAARDDAARDAALDTLREQGKLDPNWFEA